MAGATKINPMAFDEKLANRIRKIIKGKRGFSEKKMFGGLAFMFKDKMCFGVLGDDLVARVGSENYDKALAKSNVRPMDFTGRPMKGYVYVSPSGLKSKKALNSWLDLCVHFTSSLR